MIVVGACCRRPRRRSTRPSSAARGRRRRAGCSPCRRRRPPGCPAIGSCTTRPSRVPAGPGGPASSGRSVSSTHDRRGRRAGRVVAEVRAHQLAVPRPRVLGVGRRVDARVAAAGADVALERRLLGVVEHVARRRQEDHRRRSARGCRRVNSVASSVRVDLEVVAASPSFWIAAMPGRDRVVPEARPSWRRRAPGSARRRVVRGRAPVTGTSRVAVPPLPSVTVSLAVVVAGRRCTCATGSAGRRRPCRRRRSPTRSVSVVAVRRRSPRPSNCTGSGAKPIVGVAVADGITGAGCSVRGSPQPRRCRRP